MVKTRPLVLVFAALCLVVTGPVAAYADVAPSATANGAPASVGAPATTRRAMPAVAAAASGIDLCAQVGAAAGFPRDSRLVNAVAVAMAESSCVPSAEGFNGATSGCPNGSVDRGLWQINSCYHPEVSDSCAYNAGCNAGAAYQISSGGTNWQPWSTYNSGAYRAWLSQAQAAVNRLCTSCTAGTVMASPSVNVRSTPHISAPLAGTAAYGDSVTISCWSYGDQVNQGYWPSSIWDRITDPATGAAGYAADTWIQTSADVRTLTASC